MKKPGRPKLGEHRPLYEKISVLLDTETNRMLKEMVAIRPAIGGKRSDVVRQAIAEMYRSFKNEKI